MCVRVECCTAAFSLSLSLFISMPFLCKEGAKKEEEEAGADGEVVDAFSGAS